MATAPSLFGATPESIQQARDAALNQEANAYAQLDPFQRASAGLYRGGSQLGGAIGRMLGGQDPEMQRASLLRQLGSQADSSTPEGMAAYAQALRGAGLQQEAFAASQQAQQMRLTGLDLTSRQQGVDSAAAAQAKEADFLKAVKALGPSPTQAQLLAAAAPFGDAKTLVSNLQASSDRAEARAQKAEEFTSRQTENARLQTERLDAEAARTREARADRQASVQSNREFAAALKGAPRLAPGLQKDEDKDLAKYDSGLAQMETVSKPLASLRADPVTGAPPLLVLGPVQNLRYQAANFRGQSTPASKAYEQYQAALTEANNIKVDAAAGIQTNGDVIRQANGLITAFGKNDNEVSIQAIIRFNEALEKAGMRTKGIIESRRKSQGVESYYGTPAAATAAPKAPQYASNPATGQKIMSMDGGLTWQPRR
jgi:hypothetical protein